jgi:hypothetical protein
LLSPEQPYSSGRLAPNIPSSPIPAISGRPRAIVSTDVGIGGYPAGWIGAAILAALSAVLVLVVGETRTVRPALNEPMHIVHRPAIPVALGFLTTNFLGWLYFGGGDTGALFQVVDNSTIMITRFTLAPVPLFVLMGSFASVSGMGTDLYRTAYTWVGHRKGGLAAATIIACAGFAALSGSSVAAAATMGKVSLPEMRRYKYDSRLATGSIAAGGTLGILIPPSIVLILYGIITQTSIGALFVAAVVPGMITTALLVATVLVLVKRNPGYAPRVDVRFTWAERFRSTRALIPVLLLFGLGVVPMKPRAGDGPLWIAAVAGIVFMLAGLSIAVGRHLIRNTEAHNNAGFGILAGIWPLHTWSPDGHASAPTAVSMLHPGVLMKLGACTGFGLYHIGAQMRGETYEAFLATRKDRGAT